MKWLIANDLWLQKIRDTQCRKTSLHTWSDKHDGISAYGENAGASARALVSMLGI